MNFKSYISKFLTNKLVLNIVALIALFNVIGYIVMGHINNVLLFIILAILVRYFSKNMILVLGIPLLFVNLLSLKKNITFEGLENNRDNSNTSTSTSDNTSTSNDKINKQKQKAVIDKINQKSNSLDLSNIESDTTDTTDTIDTTETVEDVPESFEPGRKKNRGTQIDYAATIEDAYDQLNNILGSDGIKRLTNDTQNLMKQQSQLAESMQQMGPLIKGMAPMMETAKEMMNSMSDNGSLQGVMDLASNFTKKMGIQK
jgi:hypothetical protein